MEGLKHLVRDWALSHAASSAVFEFYARGNHSQTWNLGSSLQYSGERIDEERLGVELVQEAVSTVASCKKIISH